jgi:hypothetical protein
LIEDAYIYFPFPRTNLVLTILNDDTYYLHCPLPISKLMMSILIGFWCIQRIMRLHFRHRHWYYFLPVCNAWIPCLWSLVSTLVLWLDYLVKSLMQLSLVTRPQSIDRFSCRFRVWVSITNQTKTSCSFHCPFNGKCIWTRFKSVIAHPILCMYGSRSLLTKSNLQEPDCNRGSLTLFWNQNVLEHPFLVYVSSSKWQQRSWWW